MPRHPLALACAVALAAALTTATAPAEARTDARVVQTRYALSGSGYGTRLGGGDLPVGSGATAYQHIGCTDKTGLSHTNDLAEEDVPDLGTISGLKTRV